jgi:hypothetical protein
MRPDIDYVDCDGEGLVYDDDWITPCYSKGYRKLRLSESIGVYYRNENGHFLRFDVVLSFDYIGARAPKSLPILYYSFVNMLDIWEKFGAESEDDSE